MPHPRIAVIIPCYNDGPLAVEAAGSIDEQETVELVVVNDGSTQPETQDALSELAQSGVRVIHQENGGLCAARMAGVAATQAPLIFPLDSDDLLLPGALAALADALEADPAATFAFGDVDYFGDREFQSRSPEFDPWLTLWGNFWSPSIMIRRERLLDAGGWSLNDLYEDWDLMMTLAERGERGVHCGRTTFRHRFHGFRMVDAARARHAELYERLRDRHPALFARQPELARQSPNATTWARMTYPVRYGAARRYMPSGVERTMFMAKKRLLG